MTEPVIDEEMASLTREVNVAEGRITDVRAVLDHVSTALVVVGDGATVARHPFYERFLQHAQATGAWRSAWDREAT